VVGQLVDLPPQVHVLEQLLRQALELRPLLGRHRVEHRLHGGHLLCHLLEQLVEVLRVAREEVAELVHEALECGLGVLARLAHLEHLVERAEHVLHARHVLRAHVAHRAGHLVEVALHELLLELVDQLVEALPRLRRGEVVVAQLTHHARQVGREHVELGATLGRDLLSDLGSALVARVACLLRELVDAGPLHLDDIAQLLGDVVVDAAEVVALELVATTPAEPLEELADAREPLAVLVAEARLEHAAQCRVEITVVQQVVGDLGEDAVGVELEADLGAVPA
jgi:hypothetical protein